MMTMRRTTPRRHADAAMERWLVPGLVAFLMVLEMALSVVVMRDVTREGPPAPTEIASGGSPLATR